MDKEAKGRQPLTYQEEAMPQGGPEHLSLPDVLDVLVRRAQLRDSWVQFRRSHKHQHTREYLALRNEHLEKVEQLGDEVASLYPAWKPRDQLIFDLYTTSKEWRFGISSQETQAFIARVQSPPMTEDELREEIRKAKEAQERKAAIAKKISQTQRHNRTLSLEDRERSRAYQRRKRESRLQAERPQPTQVFPDPPKSNTS